MAGGVRPGPDYVGSPRGRETEKTESTPLLEPDAGVELLTRAEWQEASAARQERSAIDPRLLLALLLGSLVTLCLVLVLRRSTPGSRVAPLLTRPPGPGEVSFPGTLCFARCSPDAPCSSARAGMRLHASA